MKRGSERPWSTPERRAFRWWVLVLCLGGAATAIVGKAVYLQVATGEHWAQVAAEQHRGRTPLPARRGGIYDRNGIPLALTHETYGAAVAPRELRDPAAVAQRLVSVLGLSRAEARRATSGDRRWVVLPGRFSAEQFRALAGTRGVHFERRLDRFYPQGDVAREVIGSVSGDDRALGGIERQFDDLLRGTHGYSVVRRNAHGAAQTAISLPVVPPADGADVHLTIDVRLQEIADNALSEAIRNTGAAGGDLLLADPRTGELLAAVSRRPGTARSLAAITEPYEPGSTLKPFVVAALLAEGRAGLDDMIDAENGVWRIGRRTIRDVHPYTQLSLRDALRVSSNIAIVKLATELSPGEQYRYLRDFGFGTPTGIEYPAESSGRLRRPAQWSGLSQTSLAMGYELSVTPLQLLMAYGALANGGVLFEPHLLREVRSPEGEALIRTQVQPLRRVLPKEVTTALTDVLVTAVSEGTATRASLITFDVAGKTGTARRTGSVGRYEGGSYTASFAGYFPARDPQLVVFVKLDNPRGAFYGGLTAAPVTRETLQGILAAHTRAFDGTALLTSRRDPQPVRQRAPRVAALDGREGPFVFLLADGAPQPEPPRREPVAIPVLEGMTMRDAVRRAHALGLQVTLRGTGEVVATVPTAGATLAPGDTLRIVGRDR
jgi:cell division protein FtsI (penicillin-binding protein 3)